jgi:hypothetical protein
MRIDSSGRVLVGTTSTLGGTSAGAIVNAVSSGNNLSLEKSTGGAIGFYQSGVITSLIEDVSSQGGLRFYTGTSGTVTEKVRIPAAGGLQVVNCVSVGNATPSASGAGITFPATQSASSDANTLDDYEEGTWTPTITRASTGPTLTVSNSGRYVKIGRQVTLWGKITITAVTAQGTNVWIITSLPFVMSGQRGAMGASGNFSTTSISTTTNITAVGDAIVDNYLYCQNSDGSTTDANFQAGSLYFTITYET